MCCCLGIAGYAFITYPGLAGNNGRNSHTRQLNPGFGSVDDYSVTLAHRRISADLTFRRYDNNVFRKVRKNLLNLCYQGLSRRQRSSYLRRMHANQQLQLRTRNKIPDRLNYPLEHVRKGVGPVVQLRIPHDVGQHTDTRTVEIHAQLGSDRRKIFFRFFVKPNPISGPVPSALQVVHHLFFHSRIPA